MTMYAAGYNCSDIQLLAHLSRINVAAPVVDHYAARNHSKFGKFRQAIDQAFGDFIVKVFRIAVGTVVHKGQNCD